MAVGYCIYTSKLFKIDMHKRWSQVRLFMRSKVGLQETWNGASLHASLNMEYDFRYWGHYCCDLLHCFLNPRSLILFKNLEYTINGICYYLSQINCFYQLKKKKCFVKQLSLQMRCKVTWYLNWINCITVFSRAPDKVH